MNPIFCKDCRHYHGKVGRYYSGPKYYCSRKSIEKRHYITGKIYLKGMKSCGSNKRRNCKYFEPAEEG